MDTPAGKLLLMIIVTVFILDILTGQVLRRLNGQERS